MSIQPTPIHVGPVVIGTAPRVVGVISHLETVPSLLDGPNPGCDIVEMRLDQMDLTRPDWLDAARSLEAAGYPVIATLRLQEEGGGWHESDEARRPHLADAIAQCSCVDVELCSVLRHELIDNATRRRKALILSHHDFKKTPSTEALTDIIERASAGPSIVVKVAVTINQPEDIDRLRALLRRPPTSAPLCLIGMGDAGAPARIEFPRHGSCLAYGHIDGATAPGQLSCAELSRQIKFRSSSR